MIGIFLLLAALRQHDLTRGIFAVFAMIVLGPTLLSTQSAYQYARRHADEIVAAGCELLDQCHKIPVRHTVKPDDARVPSVLRKLGANSIVVTEKRLSMYVPGLTPAEFQIYRAHPTQIYTAWKWKKGKGSGQLPITDRLWMIIDD